MEPATRTELRRSRFSLAEMVKAKQWEAVDSRVAALTAARQTVLGSVRAGKCPERPATVGGVLKVREEHAVLASLVATLQAGAYELSLPVLDHLMNELDRQVTAHPFAPLKETSTGRAPRWRSSLALGLKTTLRDQLAVVPELCRPAFDAALDNTARTLSTPYWRPLAAECFEHIYTVEALLYASEAPLLQRRPYWGWLLRDHFATALWNGLSKPLKLMDVYAGLMNARKAEIGAEQVVEAVGRSRFTNKLASLESAKSDAALLIAKGCTTDCYVGELSRSPHRDLFGTVGLETPELFKQFHTSRIPYFEPSKFALYGSNPDDAQPSLVDDLANPNCVDPETGTTLGDLQSQNFTPGCLLLAQHTKGVPGMRAMTSWILPFLCSPPVLERANRVADDRDRPQVEPTELLPSALLARRMTIPENTRPSRFDPSKGVQLAKSARGPRL